MQKRRAGRKLGRKSGQRKALLVSLSGALLLKEKITTTEAKAKELAGFVAKFIALAKLGTLHSQRLLSRVFRSQIVKKLVQDIAARYKERNGGYTRIIKLGRRKSDGAEMAVIELIK